VSLLLFYSLMAGAIPSQDETLVRDFFQRSAAAIRGRL